MSFAPRTLTICGVAAGVLVVTMVVSTRLQAQAGASTQSHMKEHFSTAVEIQHAVIRGQVDDVHAPAKWMVEHQTDQGMPPQAKPLLEAMRGLAKQAATATELNVAASAAARMASGCGSCHASLGVKVSSPDVQRPAPATDVAGHMRDHQWAIDQMYAGLVDPSDDAWSKGAQALRRSKLATIPPSGDAAVAQKVTALEARVHELADRAPQVIGASGRAAIYGELIAGCGDCHALQGRVLGPRAPK